MAFRHDPSRYPNTLRCVVCGDLMKAGQLMNWNRKKGVDSRVWHDPKYSCLDSAEQAHDAAEKDSRTEATQFETENNNQDRQTDGENENMTQTTTKTNGKPAGWLEGLAYEILPFIEEKISTKVDAEEVAKLIEEKLKGAIFTTVQKLEIKLPTDAEWKDAGVQHKCMADLLIACSARDKDGNRLNIWLVGPAGTGKSTAPKMVAKILGLPFYVHGAIASAHEMMGYVDANGVYHTTGFRQGWQDGGVVLKDEVDADFANAQMPFNGGLANGQMAFPDSPNPVPRHQDCIIIAAANTWGLAATIDYCGRNKMDAAFLNRFVQIEWPIDEALELATGPNREWTLKVQAWRKAAKTKGIKNHMITPRATYNGAAIIQACVAAGQSEVTAFAKAASWCVKTSMSDADWAAVNASAAN